MDSGLHRDDDEHTTADNICILGVLGVLAVINYFPNIFSTAFTTSWGLGMAAFSSPWL